MQDAQWKERLASMEAFVDQVKGMEELNGHKPRRVLVKGPYTFSIGDTSALGNYVSGGIFTQIKLPKTLHFVSPFICCNHGSLPKVHTFITEIAP